MIDPKKMMDQYEALDIRYQNALNVIASTEQENRILSADNATQIEALARMNERITVLSAENERQKRINATLLEEHQRMNGVLAELKESLGLVSIDGSRNEPHG